MNICCQPILNFFSINSENRLSILILPKYIIVSDIVVYEKAIYQHLALMDPLIIAIQFSMVDLVRELIILV